MRHRAFRILHVALLLFLVLAMIGIAVAHVATYSQRYSVQIVDSENAMLRAIIGHGQFVLVVATLPEVRPNDPWEVLAYRYYSRNLFNIDRSTGLANSPGRISGEEKQWTLTSSPRLNMRKRQFPDVLRFFWTDPRELQVCMSVAAKGCNLSIWELFLPLWVWCVPLFGLALLLGWRPLRQQSRRKRGLCTGCGYDLRGSPSGRCPECGAQQ